ncbi:hypothetical protein PlfCFBP13513_04685 [Plantibacter flavus]|nr:hypothetical protein PlfCFBP13513_04685 [Plantibacter flavus]
MCCRFGPPDLANPSPVPEPPPPVPEPIPPVPESPSPVPVSVEGHTTNLTNPALFPRSLSLSKGTRGHFHKRLDSASGMSVVHDGLVP